MDSITYRKALQDIHKHLSNDNVKALKFLVQPVIKKRRHDEIQTGFEFFDALEDSNMLSKDNLVILSALLEAVRRIDMKSRLEEYIVMTDAVAEEGKYLVCPFRKMLYLLREEMTEDDLRCMRYLCDMVPRRAKVDDPLDLFIILIQEDCLGPNKLDFLMDILREVNRNDLVKKIRHFQNTVDPKDCGYKQDFSEFPSKESPKISPKVEQGPVFQEPTFESLGSNMSSNPSYSKDKEHLFGQESIGSESQLSGAGPVFKEAAVEQGSFVPLEETMHVEQALAPQMHDTVTHIPNGHNHYMMRDKSKCYKMDATPRGPCLIIDVEDFTYDANDKEASQLQKRKGSSVDRESLTTTFKELYFDVKHLINPTDAEIYKSLVSLSRTPMQKCDCLVICILSHGGLGYFYASNGRKVQEKLLTKLFCAKECPSLAGKPKLFFFSFCRGKDHQPAVPVAYNSLESIQSDGPGSPDAPSVPNEADFLFGYATIPENVAYRSTTQGTFYIDKLTQVLRESAHRDELLHILVEVNRRVAEREYPNPKESGQIKKQVPRPEYTLLKQLYFL